MAKSTPISYHTEAFVKSEVVCTVAYYGYCWMTIRNESWFFPNYNLYRIITKILQSCIYFTISITFAESVFSNFANIFDSFDQKFYDIL